MSSVYRNFQLQITIVKFGFIVPLDFNADAILEAIDLVSWAVDHVLIDAYLRRELLLLPSMREKSLVD